MSIKMNHANHKTMTNMVENYPMHNGSFTQLVRASLGLAIVALGLCGLSYSIIMTGFGQMFFPEQANGSLILKNNQVVGSKLVAQAFIQDQYFQSRPSVANYDPMAMTGSNMAQTNPDLQWVVQERIRQISVREKIDPEKIPVDLVTASGSGIDPEISVQSALIQVKRIAKKRSLHEAEVIKLITQFTQKPTFGILGVARVNVLELNLALDQIKP